MGRMKSIDQVLIPMGMRFQELRERRAQLRRDRAAQFGWEPECRCAECGDTGTVPERGTICWCDAGEQLQRQLQTEQRWSLCVPERFRDYRLDTSPQPALAQEARGWIVTAPWRRGENLLLSGTTGTGKTGLAIGLMREAFLAGTVPAIVNVPAWLDDQRPQNGFVSDDGRRAMQVAVAPELLVLDDLGAEKSSAWVQERIYVLVNERYERRRSTIVTTNHERIDRLEAAIGARALSRLLEHVTIIAVTGPDYRSSGTR